MSKRRKILVLWLVLTLVLSSTPATAKQIEKEGDRAYPYVNYNYSGSRAAAYAEYQCTRHNPYFYYATRNCTNFVSQSVSYGFGSTTAYSLSTSYRMVQTGTYTSGWYADSGGGCSNWENVSNHWNYMISGKNNLSGPRVNYTTVTTVQVGDVVQIDFDNDGEFTHSIICTSIDPAGNPVFHQNTYDGIRYWEDVEKYSTRIYRPLYFREY